VTDHLFKELPESPVWICRHVIDGARLDWVHHVPEELYVWQLTCKDTYDLSDMVEITLAEASRLFLEIIELADVPQDMEVSFKKGITSGKWYDFHPKK